VRAAARRQSLVGLILMAVILAWPLVALIADSAIKARRAARYESRTSSGGGSRG
jgi:hypothetical protein